MNNVKTKAISLGLVLIVVAGAASSAMAERPRHRVHKGDWITAISQYGDEKISAPLRRSAEGPQVQLPGGTWIDCAGDCRNTLRDQTVDFWDHMEQDEK